MNLAIVTGASSGIGLETALLLSKSGYRVVACARRVELMEEYRSNTFIPFKLDVTDKNSINALVSR